ncbi:MAG: 50S ribosomal protein L3 [Candidatus Caenarcaniphilales bacterium]|jgi:large subunit ribosomal protein L3|nr:50S ribosomal protein L3 [Candidatus Caenarcaniphilales bacterium]
MASDIKNLGLIGKKIGMTQVFDEEGNVIPATIIQIQDNIITGIKTKEKDGYDAIQLGAFASKEKHLTKPERVSLQKKNLPLLRKLKEFRSPEKIEGLNIGDALNAEEFFKDLKKVDVTANSIGKGFQGGVKLHNMGVGRNSHGSKSKRQIGSIGPGTTPGNVKKGKKMPAMMGNRTVTTAKLKVARYDAENKLLIIRGPVPGKAGNTLFIKAFGVRTWNHYNKASA